ncbi:hypothetical protein EJ06DRAFT_371446 [Trichodelitschia bisporula]|uniref:Uncharacterized protein n=1 Tax=Trichodelitschia bisporula TaxID=703511 RepID=A0A6G1I1E5_9PEZI|nr:hypothetical protein EJ06DRAFT_371446 [Trichodelitschia bisporula]
MGTGMYRVLQSAEKQRAKISASSNARAEHGPASRSGTSITCTMTTRSASRAEAGRPGAAPPKNKTNITNSRLRVNTPPLSASNITGNQRAAAGTLEPYKRPGPRGRHGARQEQRNLKSHFSRGVAVCRRTRGRGIAKVFFPRP